MSDPFDSAAEVIRQRLSGDEHFAVTGASGWFGRTSLDIFARIFGDDLEARVASFTGTTPEVTLLDGRKVPCRPLGDLVVQDPPPTHLLHFACLTRDRVAEIGIGPYLRANVEITATVIDAVARHRPRGLLFTSSGAVYNADRSLAVNVEANPYGVLKRIDELTLRAAVAEGGGRTVIARVFSVSGPYMTKPHLYALGDLIEQARSGGPVVVRADHPVRRSYVAAADVLAVGLGALLDPGDGSDVTFDSGGEVVEVGELARTVCEVLAQPPDVVQREWDPTTPPDEYIGDPLAMFELRDRLGVPSVDLRTQILAMVALAGPLHQSS